MKKYKTRSEKRLDRYPLMGHIVTVHKEFRREGNYIADDEVLYEDKYRRSWHSVNLKNPRAGWFVGERHLQEGVYCRGGYYSGESDGDYDPPYFNVENVKKCIMVCYWPTMNCVYVPIDGFTEGGIPVPSIRTKKECPEDYSEDYLKEASKYAKMATRDEKGRFCIDIKKGNI